MVTTTGYTGVDVVYKGEMHVSPDQVPIAWDAPDDSRVTHYEIRILWLDQNPPMIINLGETTETQAIIERPRTGHFKIQVRSLSREYPDKTSEWTDSLTPDDTTNNP